MLKSNSLLNDKEISIKEQEIFDNIFTNKQINRLETNEFSEKNSFTFSLQNQSAKGLFFRSFMSAKSNEDLISKLNCLDFIGKKRKLSNQPNCDFEKDEKNIYTENSSNKGINALADNENIMWISKNKNFKFSISKNQETNTESPMRILNRDRLSNTNIKKSNLNCFNGESKITDFFREKKKNYNLINKQIGLNSFETKEPAFNTECFDDPKNCKSLLKSYLPSKKEEKKLNSLANEKLKFFHFATHNKMLNKNIIELYNLNKKTTMEEIDNKKPFAIVENPNSESTCDLLHDKLISTAQNNLKNKINYFNLEGNKNNSYNNEKNSLIIINNNDLSAPNHLNNNEKKRMENSNLNASGEKPIPPNSSVKGFYFSYNPEMINYDNFINGEVEGNYEEKPNENLDLNEIQDYNNILKERQNKNYDFSLDKERQKEIPFTLLKNQNKNENNSLNLLENSFSNLLLKEAQNTKTPFKKVHNYQPENLLTSSFLICNNFSIEKVNLEKTNPSLHQEENKADYEVLNVLNNFDSKEKPKHCYFLRSQRINNKGKTNKLCGVTNKRTIRFSLSKKKVMRKQNRKNICCSTNSDENKVLLSYFNPINPNFMSSIKNKDKYSFQNSLILNLNLNHNKNNQSNKKITAEGALKGKLSLYLF